MRFSAITNIAVVMYTQVRKSSQRKIIMTILPTFLCPFIYQKIVKNNTLLEVNLIALFGLILTCLYLP